MDALSNQERLDHRPDVFSLPLIWLIIITISIAGLTVWTTQAYKEVTLRTIYNAPTIHRFGDSCEIAISIRDLNLPELSIILKPHEFKPFAMPSRTGERAIKINTNEYLFTRCTFDGSKAKGEGFAWLQLGRVFGHSHIFINNELRQIVGDGGIAEFPLLPKDLRGVNTLSVISGPPPYGNAPGFSTNMPLFFTDARGSLDEINRSRAMFRSELPLFRVGYALALFITFASVWTLGSRYRDVGWMVILTGILVAENLISYRPTSDWTMAQSYGRSTGYIAIALAYGPLLESFYRTQMGRFTSLIYTVLVIVYFMICVSLPEELYRAWGFTGIIPRVVAGVILITIAIKNQHKKIDLPRKRRIQTNILAWVAVSSGAIYLLEAALVKKTGIVLYEYINFTIITIFALYVVIDLVIMQMAYYQEKEAKAAEQAKREYLEERLEMGKKVQNLLLPKNTAGTFGPFEYSFYHEAAEKMAGDWFYIWPTQNELHLLIGDVVGKGPEAAIAVSSIMTLLHETLSAGQNLSSALNHVGERLETLFGGQINTTVTAATLTIDGDIKLYNAASSGWYLIRPDAAIDNVSSRSSPLGNGAKVNENPHLIKAEKNLVLTSFSDGVIDSPREAKKVLKKISTITMSLEDIKKLALESAKVQMVTDDKTMLLIACRGDKL